MPERIQIDVNAYLMRRPGRAAWYVETCHGGIQLRRSLGTWHKGQAIERAKALLKQGAARTWGTAPVGAVRIVEFVEEWLEGLEKRNRAPSTLALNRTACRQFIAWLEDELRFTHEAMLKDVTPERLQDYLACRSKTQSPATANRDRRILRGLFSCALKKGVVASNPVLATDPVTAVRRVKPVPTEEEIRRLLDEAQRPVKLLGPGGKGNGSTRERNPLVLDVSLMIVNTGLRLMEALTLQWIDVELAADRIVVRTKSENRIKDHEERHVPLTDAVRDLLLRRRQAAEGPGWVFATSGGRAPDPASFRHLFKRVASRAGLGWINPQALRRAFASLCAAAGMPPLVLKELMGHASVSTTERHYIGSNIAGAWRPRSIG
jgi:integrase